MGAEHDDSYARSPPQSRTGSIELTEEQISQIESVAESAEKSTKSRLATHFTDRIIEKLLKATLPPDIPEREVFEQRLNDPARNIRPGLSVPTLASNVKQIAKRMTKVFALQYQLIHIVTWRQPNKTLSVLVLYTAACVWPHLILAYPLMLVLFGVLLPGYAYRHPPRRPDLIKVKKRGQSLFKFLNASSETSIVEDAVDMDYLRQDAEVASTASVSNDSDVTISSTVALSKSGDLVSNEKKETARRRKSNIAFLINLRDFQNLTSDLLTGIEKSETFYYETAGFKDERLSTFIFYGVLVATFGIFFLGPFIPWRMIFIQTGWVGLILCHPEVKKFLVQFGNSKKETAKLLKAKAEIEAESRGEEDKLSVEEKAKARAKLESEPKSESESKPGSKPGSKPEFKNEINLKNIIKQFDRYDIIVDDSPEVKIVEIYELQIKSILKHNWSFYRYSNSIYSKTDKHRMAGKRPTGVESLSRVYPPHDWKFDAEFVNKWILDTDPKEFLKARSMDPTDLFVIKENEKEGWIYDNTHDILQSDIVYEFRRRRLYRECFRYGRHHPKPR
ncbi:uncharacterized protein LODBEIA_P32900 [Lodderomyces beijingensis]|uniref:TECPR1-like DysF domain-containing protein n=1 Tax=Lodderomyces beijingensis TaxID=1775926 RepID=A0ABP0ZPL5_9ASCO